MVDHKAFGDLNDANNMAAYQAALAAEAEKKTAAREQRDLFLQQRGAADKAYDERSGGMLEDTMKLFQAARKNPLGAVFGMMGSGQADLRALGNKLLTSMDPDFAAAVENSEKTSPAPAAAKPTGSGWPSIRKRTDSGWPSIGKP